MSNKRHKDLWMPTSHRDTGIIQGYTASTPWGSQGNFISTLLPGCARTTAATTFGPGMITTGTIAPGLGTSYRTGAIGKREGARRSVRDNDLLARKGLPNPTPMRRGLKPRANGSWRRKERGREYRQEQAKLKEFPAPEADTGLFLPLSLASLNPVT